MLAPDVSCIIPNPSHDTHKVCSLCEGQAAKGDRKGSTEEGWLYESPQHAADCKGGGAESREGSVEDGELPRAAVHFSLTASKTSSLQNAQPSAQPNAIDAQKHTAEPSDKAVHAPVPISAPPGAQYACNEANFSSETLLLTRCASESPVKACHTGLHELWIGV